MYFYVLCSSHVHIILDYVTQKIYRHYEQVIPLTLSGIMAVYIFLFFCEFKYELYIYTVNKNSFDTSSVIITRKLGYSFSIILNRFLVLLFIINPRDPEISNL